MSAINDSFRSLKRSDSGTVRTLFMVCQQIDGLINSGVNDTINIYLNSLVRQILTKALDIETAKQILEIRFGKLAEKLKSIPEREYAQDALSLIESINELLNFKLSLNELRTQMQNEGLHAALELLERINNIFFDNMRELVSADKVISEIIILLSEFSTDDRDLQLSIYLLNIYKPLFNYINRNLAQSDKDILSSKYNYLLSQTKFEES